MPGLTNSRGATSFLYADSTAYPVDVQAGGLIANVRDPYGSGSAFSAVGTVPSQLKLEADGRIVAGTGAHIAGRVYTITVRAAKEGRATEEPLSFVALLSGSLPQLTVSPASVTLPQDTAAGVLVANIGNVPSGITPVLGNDQGGRFAIAGSSGNWRIVTGLTALAAGPVNLTVTAAGAQSANVAVTVPAVVTLAALTLTGSLQVGVAASGSINGASTGSTIAANIPGVTINSAARTYSGTPTTAGGYQLTETLAGATNSPRNSAVTVAAAATPAPSFTTQPSISPASGNVGQTFTANNGAASNATSYARRWLLNGTQIGTGATVTPVTAGMLVLEVTATGPTNPAAVATSAGVAVAGATQAPAFLNIFTLADIDPANERDDEPMMSLFLADQPRFNIRGMVADAPDGLTSGYKALTDAYDLDRTNLLSYGTAAQYKTKAQLEAVTYQGSRVDTPTVGYWATWDSGDALAAHNSAQALIAAADAYGTTAGTPITNPAGKLWVVIGGGWTTLAQALYEAIDLGQDPDFLKKIAIVGQSKHNSYVTKNSWRYICNNQWRTAGVPGKFGDFWAVIGGWMWHSLNRDNGGSDVTFWRNVTSGSAMGAALENERKVSNYKTEYFRAADAGAWFWLSEAMRLNSFDPTNAANKMGPYRLYDDGTGWPYNRSPALWGPSNSGGGWPTGSGYDTRYSPTHWGPPESASSQETALALIPVDAPGHWYDQATAMMDRYKAAAGALAFTANPVVSGSAVVGGTLTCSPGTITGSPTPTLAYQWRNNGVAISGATSASYTVAAGLVGRAIDCLVTATNANGSASRDSNDVTIAASGGEDADTTAWVATFSAAPTTADRAAYDQFVKTLKSAGVWDKRDAIAFLAAKNETGALTDVKRRVAAAKSGAVTHTPGTGMLASAGGHLTPGINFGDGGTYQWQRNSANVAVYVMGEGNQSTPARAVGTVANSAISLTNSSSSGVFSARVNQATGTATTSTSGINFGVKEYFAGNRVTSSATQIVFGETFPAENGPHASEAVANSPIRYLADGSGNSYSVPIGYIAMGGGLTTEEMAAERAAVRSLITALGGTP